LTKRGFELRNQSHSGPFSKSAQVLGFKPGMASSDRRAWTNRHHLTSAPMSAAKYAGVTPLKCSSRRCRFHAAPPHHSSTCGGLDLGGLSMPGHAGSSGDHSRRNPSSSPRAIRCPVLGTTSAVTHRDIVDGAIPARSAIERIDRGSADLTANSCETSRLAPLTSATLAAVVPLDPCPTVRTIPSNAETTDP